MYLFQAKLYFYIEQIPYLHGEEPRSGCCHLGCLRFHLEWKGTRWDADVSSVASPVAFGHEQLSDLLGLWIKESTMKQKLLGVRVCMSAWYHRYVGKIKDQKYH